jgi:hypothetical protein
MAITLSQPPPMASAKLEPTDVAAIVSALSPVITLPVAEDWTKVTAINLNISPDGSAVFNVRFKQ